MKIKLLIESKILLEFIKSKKEGFKGNYSEFVDDYIKRMISSKEFLEEFNVQDDTSVFKLSTLVRELGSYVRTHESFFIESPKGMTKEDALKVIAHSRRYFERYYSKFDKSICELTCRALIDMYGFNLISDNDIVKSQACELFFLNGYDMYFVNSPLFDNHFLWYEKYKDITEDSIINIYDSINDNIARRLRNGE